MRTRDAELGRGATDGTDGGRVVWPMTLFFSKAGLPVIPWFASLSATNPWTSPGWYGPEGQAQGARSKLRITHPANFGHWAGLPQEDYEKEKASWEERVLANGLRYLSKEESQLEDFRSKIILRDTFTPRTIKKYTDHRNGALYGSPVKRRDGSTHLENLFLAGTDQGYVGIVGAMLGGIAIANNRILRPG